MKYDVGLDIQFYHSSLWTHVIKGIFNKFEERKIKHKYPLQGFF